MIYNSPTVRLVSHCFTTRTSRTGRALQYTVSKSPTDIQFTNCTTRKPLFHDPYESNESYGSCTSVYGQSLYNSPAVRLVSHCFTTRTSRTSRTLQYMVYISQMIYNSPTVRLVSHCFTTRTNRTGRTSRTSRTGRALQYTVSKSP